MQNARYTDWNSAANLGSLVNSADADFDPFVSRDGLTLLFTAGRNRPPNVGLRDIWIAHRASVDEPWDAPQNLGPTINTTAHESKPTLSIDGHSLYFASNRSGGLGGFDLYVAHRRNKADDFNWEPAVNLGSPINSSASEESGITFFEDETSGSVVVYFASDRGGSSSGMDIYTSTRLPDGSFGPISLVAELSSAFTDVDPSVSRDGLELYLSSNRPGSFGANDIWLSTRRSTSDPWSTPVNAGAVINTPTLPGDVEQANDNRPSLSFDGRTLYWASAFRDGNVSFMFDLWSATREKRTGPEK